MEPTSATSKGQQLVKGSAPIAGRAGTQSRKSVGEIWAEPPPADNWQRRYPGADAEDGVEEYDPDAINHDVVVDSEGKMEPNSGAGTPTPTKKNRGFAAMDPEKQRAIASLGGKAAHERGRAHEFTKEEASAAGKKGGVASGVSRRKPAEQKDGDRGML